jgi:hypothetical protein
LAYDPPAPTIAKLGAIAAQIGAAAPIDRDFDLMPAFLARLPGGQLYLDSRLQLDTDGWPGPAGGMDEAHQDDTSLRYRDGISVDANAVPYFVLPLPPEWPAQFGISLGDYAAILHRSFLAYAVFADEGPQDKIGEGSIRLFRELGQERLKANGHVRDVDMGPRVVTIVFPGSGKGQRHFADEASLLADLRTVGRAQFLALGGDPDA